MAGALRAHPAIAGAPLESIRRRCVGHSKPEVRELSLMLQTLEAAILRCAVDTLSEHGFETGAFIADGLLVRATTRPTQAQAALDGALEAVTAAVREAAEREAAVAVERAREATAEATRREERTAAEGVRSELTTAQAELEATRLWDTMPPYRQPVPPPARPALRRGLRARPRTLRRGVRAALGRAPPSTQPKSQVDSLRTCRNAPRDPTFTLFSCLPLPFPSGELFIYGQASHRPFLSVLRCPARKMARPLPRLWSVGQPR